VAIPGESEFDALRAENARLREALTEIACQPPEHLSIQEPDLRMRYTGMRERARAALNPPASGPR